MKILIAISGGIAAYKTLDIIRQLKSIGHEVHVLSTLNGYKFVTPTTLGALSDKLITETPTDITHIDEANWCDLFLCVPATANIIAKFANGISDDLVSTIYLAIPKDTPKVICPSMNDKMYENSATQRNIKTLIKDKIIIIEPDSGMLACGYEGKGKLPKPEKIVQVVEDTLDTREVWQSPFPFYIRQFIGTTIDSYSFLDIDIEKSVEIPLYPHVGAFGIRRRHDIHKGIDLYAPEESAVLSVEEGVVVEICPFTGPKAGYDWWLDTDGIYVLGESGIVVYGEIAVKEGLKIGDKVSKHQCLGFVKRVILQDKGRPNCMLHLELHDKDHIHTGQWELGKEKPVGVLDPTPFLERIIKLY